MSSTVAVLGLVGLLVVFVILIYNKLVRLRNLVEEGWSGIDVQLKRRSNLIPNLVETVKGYMGHERDLLSKVTELRAQSMQTQQVGERLTWKDFYLAPWLTCLLWRRVILI